MAISTLLLNNIYLIIEEPSKDPKLGVLTTPTTTDTG